MKNSNNKNTGITLVSLVVTIVILLILVAISINMITENKLFNKAQTASDETKKSQATETMNLKITNIQISSYTETQKLPNLQYLADKLCEDNDMEYVLTSSKEHASLDKIDATNISSIFTKLKEYPYEFEINSSLQLASIDGVKIADNNNDGTITLTQDQYNSILSRLSALENNSNNITTNNNYSTEEQVIGTWIDGRPLYRIYVNGKLAGTTSSFADIVTLNEECEIHFFDISFASNAAGTQFVHNNYYYSNTYFEAFQVSNNILRSYGYYTGRDFEGYIEYTKTTDNATNN